MADIIYMFISRLLFGRSDHLREYFFHTVPGEKIKQKGTKKISRQKLTFIYSLNTLWYFVRNFDVTRFFISSISTGLRTCTNVAQEHLRSDALSDTTVISRELNTGPLVWKTHTMPYPLHHWHSKKTGKNRAYNFCVHIKNNKVGHWKWFMF